jgi:molecular chaperone GrpE (heat shock protein)
MKSHNSIENLVDCDNMSESSMFDDNSENLEFETESPGVTEEENEYHQRRFLEKQLEEEEARYNRLQQELVALKSKLKKEQSTLKKMREDKEKINNANSELLNSFNLMRSMVCNVEDIVKLSSFAINKCDEVSPVNRVNIPSMIIEEESEITDHEIEY